MRGRQVKRGLSDARLTACSAVIAWFVLASSGGPALAGSGGNEDAAQAVTRAAPQRRPRIGLVLGGGGAKGAAHVGVLGVLDELHIPVDCVIGTSMGALVGGTFASGRNARDLETAMLEISWEGAIAFEGQRRNLPMRRKLAGVTFSNNLEFGLHDGRLTTPSGFIKAQNIEQTIQNLVSRSRGVRDFDRLPIPYRAIATDMQSGEMVVLGSGNLAQAMRASMAVPGVFSPVTIDGRILGDGGLSRNVAVDVARQTCADIVIAVALPNPVPTAEELQSPLTLVARTLDVLIGANEKQQLDTLGPDDVKIVVHTGDLGSASFSRAREAIPIGRAAALEQRTELARYSLPEADYLEWRGAVSRGEGPAVQLAVVEVTGHERVNPQYVRDVLALEPGDTVTERQLAGRVNDLYALSDFDWVRYALHGDPLAPSLEIELREKATGANTLRFDLGFYIGTDENTAFTIGGNYQRTWINDRGGEMHGAMQLGRTSGIDASLYQPLDRRHEWFVEPGLTLRRSLEDIFLDGDAVARYTLSHAWGFLDAGRTFGTSAELRAGMRAGLQWADRDIAFPGLEEISGEGYGGWSLRYTQDSRDREALARSGVLTRVSYFRSEEALGAIAPYERVEGMTAYAVPLGANVLHLRASGGSSLDSRLPVYDTFTLGGPVSFPGLSIGELRGTSYWSAQASYLHKVADISSLFGQSLYAGLALTAGDMSGRIDGIHADPIYSGAFLLGARTPLGPLSLSLAVTGGGDWQVVLGLGRPVDERTITDPAW
jgi:NTE family protein